MKFVRYFVVIIAALCCSCSHMDKSNVAKVVNKWVGKDISFPQRMSCKLFYNDSDGNELLGKRYKIVLYVDPYGCSECKLQLSDWRKFIEESRKYQDSLSVIIVVDTPNKKKISIICEQQHFNYPIFFDYHGEMNRINSFELDETFRCFLTDSNRVIAIGNPIQNPKVKALYLSLIDKHRTFEHKAPAITTVDCDSTVYNLGKIVFGETKKFFIALKNSGNTPLVISDILSSCGCITPTYSHSPTNPLGELLISAELNNHEEGFFEKTISIYCNIADAPITLRVRGYVTRNKNQ